MLDVKLKRAEQKQTCRLLILHFVVIISPRAVLYLQMRNRDSLLTRPGCCGGTEGGRRRCGESVQHLRLWRTDARDFPKHTRLIFLLSHLWALPSILKYRGFSLYERPSVCLSASDCWQISLLELNLNRVTQQGVSRKTSSSQSHFSPR